MGNGLQDKIEMKGAIYDVHEKAKVICRAIACVSPFQAGLSVLECLGYGVPFVTCKDAITGGELFNIQNGKNGVLLDDAGELKDVILDMTNNKRKYIIMGENGYSYYWKYRTPEIMAQGLIDAIRFVDPA